MTTRKTAAAFGVFVLVALLAFASTPHAVIQGSNKCLAGKNKCVSKKAAGVLNCHVKAEKAGLDVAGPEIAACIARARAKFDGALRVPPDPAKGCVEKLEEKDPNGPGSVVTEDDCGTFDDTVSLEAKVDDFIDDVVAELDPSFPAPATNKCSAGKKKCVLKKMAALMRCHEKAVKGGLPVPGAQFGACIHKARAKFDGSLLIPPDSSRGCFEKLEAKDPNGGPGGTSEDDCATFDDTGALETKVDDFVTDVLCELGYTTLVCQTECPGFPFCDCASFAPPNCQLGSCIGGLPCVEAGSQCVCADQPTPTVTPTPTPVSSECPGFPFCGQTKTPTPTPHVPTPTPTPSSVPSECPGFPFCQCQNVLPQQGCSFGLCPGGAPCVSFGTSCGCLPSPTPTP